jgi:NADH-quinone oxidoreductase subunit N
MWTPDVYEGAPAPVSGFLAAVSKAAVFAALLRWWLETGFYTQASLQTALAILAGASMLVGNLLALRQDNIKRLLAYSSIAHIGYLLVLLVACGASPQPREAVEAATYYLLAYTITTLAAFALLGLLSRDLTASERDRIEDLAGLFWQRPWLSILLSVALLSLAGIPLTAGFIGKFYIFAVGVSATLWSLLGILVVGSGISIYYYLRVIFTMTRQPEEPDLEGQPGLSLVARVACVSLVAAMLYLGILPETLMLYLRTIL